MSRLHTIVILAMSADGKIADKSRSPARFGSTIDKAHLESQIALVDGVIFGAGTLRAYGTTKLISDRQLLQARKTRSQPLQPVQIVVSATGNLDRDLRFFQQPVPRWLLTTVQGAKLWRNCDRFDRLIIGNGNSFNWLDAFSQLQQLGLNKIAVLGGAELVASLLAEDLIDELWLTICPIILGGKNAPTPVAGIGFTETQAKKLQLLEVKQIETEVFLHYAVT
ncbi:RibD family protein [Myxosarcina sp. GI1]|uniref:RibD family protein n=1 Tax=Myxosarcina sp. GI1 TaxID=1541065 RepID=UPI001C1080CF|nr:RibD family protein [Myxosarcina sp. GI1]